MISIIIPTYNRANTIKGCIDSIIKQTYQEFEIIIVDDNSQDDTEKIVKSIDDKRIRYIRNDKNKGANESRNIGVSNAVGEYVAFQDSDDEWLENKLEIQIEELIKSGADIVASSFYRYEDGKMKIVPSENVIDKDISNKLLYGNFISTQTILGKKECFINERFDREFPRFQDWELMLRMSRIYKIHFINKPLVNVYVQADSISKNHAKAIVALKMIIKKYNAELINNKNAMVAIYKELGHWSTKMNDFSENYYRQALKFDNTNIKVLIKSIIFELMKARQYILQKL